MFKLCSILFLLAAPAFGQTLTGPIRVIDADTIDIGVDANIRLVGIDAAEGAQTCLAGDGATVPCGQMATDATRGLYEGKIATCQVEDLDRYDRYLAVCFVGGLDMNAYLVDRGLARVYRDDMTYAEEQKAAILFGRGLWAYDMQAPHLWRADRRAPRPEDAAPDPNCRIKGNISASGRIYHLPGSRSYDDTRINPSNGEQWFCSEGAARAAGWRAPRS